MYLLFWLFEFKTVQRYKEQIQRKVLFLVSSMWNNSKNNITHRISPQPTHQNVCLCLLYLVDKKEWVKQVLLARESREGALWRKVTARSRSSYSMETKFSREIFRKGCRVKAATWETVRFPMRTNWAINQAQDQVLLISEWRGREW